MSDELLSEYDVVIIGSGIAGLYTALSIHSDKTVLVLSKDAAENSNTNLAQGGIAVTFNKTEINSHIEDTMKAGNYYNDENSLRLMIEEGADKINTLIKWGVNFDTDEEGNLLLTKEGGHSLRRIIHFKDTTGQEIVKGLLNNIPLRENITLAENVFIKDILKNDDGIYAVSMIRNQCETYVKSHNVVIATGGIGELYLNTTNATIATGDGIAMAYRIGAHIKDMEFIQFHPTALNVPGHGHFLISEAVRGEGGILRNEKGEAFMEGYHPLKDLAPRNIVAKAIFEEFEKQNNDKVYLDVTHLGEKYIVNRFPNIYKECLKRGINILNEFIPVIPVQHYIMGGIETDINGKTNITGLYACGEVACTGVHGANRMASNSLLEGVVFAGRVANSINASTFREHSHEVPNVVSLNNVIDKRPINEAKRKLQEIMDKYVFVFRTKTNLMKALEGVQLLLLEVPGYLTCQEGYELRNMVIVAKLIIEAALSRTETLGSHIIEGGH